MNIVANNLIKLRKDKVLSKEKLSKELLIPLLDLDSYENDVKIIPPEILIKYSKYFNVSIDSICDIHTNKNDKYKEFSKKLIIGLKKNDINIESLSKKDMDIITKCTIFVARNKFTDKEWKVIYKLTKIIKNCNYTEEHFDGILEILELLNIRDGIFAEDRLYEILKDIQKIVN